MKPRAVALLLAALFPAISPAETAIQDCTYTPKLDRITRACSTGPAAAMPIPADQIGVAAEKDYSGDGLSLLTTEDGAFLRCVFQRLNAHATGTGLWITSTADGANAQPFRVVARRISRRDRAKAALLLPSNGTVEVEGKLARFLRPGLNEEYSVGTNGVRQDFIIAERPAGEGEVRLELSVTGAKAEQLVSAVRLVLADAWRKLNYHRLQVSDATGKELKGKLEVLGGDQLAVVFEDSEAIYPIRVDPMFSDENWTCLAGTQGADAAVVATAVDSAGDLYIGGDFTMVGGISANHVAKWDGSSWSTLGSGMNDRVQVLAVSGSDLYAGGWFTNAGGVTANRIAKWNGSSWSPLGAGLGNDPVLSAVYALAISGTTLYVGGAFTNAGGVAAKGIAAWNGSSWSALGSGVTGAGIAGIAGQGSVLALAVSGSYLYAGGIFTNAGGINATNIARWDGSGWSAMGSGMDNTVEALVILGTNLYAGGYFTKAGGVTAKCLAKWNGSAWSSFYGVTGSHVNSLAVSGTDLYATGTFTQVGLVFNANNIAKWNASTGWSALGSGFGQSQYTFRLAAFSTNLYVGGLFFVAGGITASRVAKWNGNSWSALPSGINGEVHALAVSDNDLYAGGSFTTAGGVSATNIAKWSGSAWSALGSGMNSPVLALAISGSDLYAGGTFTNAGGISANYVAKWNGSTWSALGSGMGGMNLPGVCALAVSGTDVYAGGNFKTAGSVSITNIAKWNGSVWSPLRSGLNSTVLALAVGGTNLYAGGLFTSAGGVSANCIGKWDGSTWSALGSGMNDWVYALAVSGTTLYAGGIFTNVDGNVANRIAKWDGSVWSSLTTGINGEVDALAVLAGSLYAAGNFTAAGGISANYVAKWTDGGWSALGSGMNDRIYALTVSGIHLYAGGNFTTAGGKVPGRVAKARIGTIATSIVASEGVPTIGFSGVTGYQYDVQRATNLVSPIFWDTATLSPLSPSADGSFTFIDTSAPDKAYYRAIEH